MSQIFIQKIFSFYGELLSRTLDFQQNYGTLRLSLADSLTRRALALLLAALFIWLVDPQTFEFCIPRRLAFKPSKVIISPEKKMECICETAVRAFSA